MPDLRAPKIIRGILSLLLIPMPPKPLVVQGVKVREKTPELYLVGLTTGGGGANAVVRADEKPTVEDGKHGPVLRFSLDGEVVAEYAMAHVEGWWKAVDE